MSLLEIIILITGSVSVIFALCLVIWLFYDLIKTAFKEPCLLNILALFVILCLFIFGSCMTYIKYTQKDTTEFQQYLDLKAKYEKEVE